jgi:hypothetical protein
MTAIGATAISPTGRASQGPREGNVGLEVRSCRFVATRAPPHQPASIARSSNHRRNSPSGSSTPSSSAALPDAGASPELVGRPRPAPRRRRRARECIRPL